MLDEQATAEALRRKRTSEEWIAWLRSMSWSYFAGGTFQQPLTAHTALTVVNNWLAPYHPSAYAAVGVARAHEKYHVHILVGSLKRTALIETQLRGSWVKRGYLWIDRYRHQQGGIEYVVRQSDEIELIGDLKLFRPGVPNNEAPSTGAR